MKRRKTNRTRPTTKRRPSRVIRPNPRGGCDLFACISKALSPVLKVFGGK